VKPAVWIADYSQWSHKDLVELMKTYDQLVEAWSYYFNSKVTPLNPPSRGDMLPMMWWKFSAN